VVRGRTVQSTDRSTPSVAVLGGGFLGLNVARELARKNWECTLYDSASTPGGVSSSFSLGGQTIDRFYHTILPSDTALLGLIGEVGLAESLAWRETRTGFYQSGRMHSVSTVPEFLRFPVLTVSERVRLGWAIFRAQQLSSWESLQDQTCEEWLTEICGRSVYEKLWAPLLRCKLGDAAPRVSATFIWATINRLQAAKGGRAIPNRDRMGYLCGGYQVLIDALVTDLQSLKTEFALGNAVTSVRRLPSGRWRIEAGARFSEVDHVVSTLPPKVLAGIVDDDEAETESLRSIEGLGVIVEVLLLEKSLSPFYILNLGDGTLPFTGIIESSNLAPENEFGGRSLVYLPRYLAPGDPWSSKSDDEVRAEFREGLRRVLPEFQESWIHDTSIQRSPFVQPLHTCDYPEKIPPKRLTQGLWVASSTQVHPWPVHNDQILRRALAVVGEMSREAAQSEAGHQDGRSPSVAV